VDQQEKIKGNERMLPEGEIYRTNYFVEVSKNLDIYCSYTFSRFNRTIKQIVRIDKIFLLSMHFSYIFSDSYIAKFLDISAKLFFL